MRKLFSLMRALLPGTRRRRRVRLSVRDRILRDNLRALLFSKEHLSDQNESAA